MKLRAANDHLSIQQELENPSSDRHLNAGFGHPSNGAANKVLESAPTQVIPFLSRATAWKILSLGPQVLFSPKIRSVALPARYDAAFSHGFDRSSSFSASVLIRSRTSRFTVADDFTAAF